ncbi:MAG: BrnT family toxin [Propionibacteriaceae bacterium]|nr:BrnT family toxin [Propionibacteriaceae bacterium]
MKICTETHDEDNSRWDAVIVLSMTVDPSSQYNYNVGVLGFEWDPNKNEDNQIKHKVGFEEASTVFFDSNALVIDDPNHSLHEKRFVIVGLLGLMRVLVVVHCLRKEGSVIRVISHRKAVPSERKKYLSGMRNG